MLITIIRGGIVSEYHHWDQNFLVKSEESFMKYELCFNRFNALIHLMDRSIFKNETSRLSITADSSERYRAHRKLCGPP